MIDKANIAGFGLEKLFRGKEDLIGAEIGVYTGTTTVFLLQHLKFNRLFCVDPWEPYKGDNTGTMFTQKAIADNSYEEFIQKTKPYEDKLAIFKMSSKEAAGWVDDDWLDFVFIDANHSYDAVMEDLKLWWPKVKIGGVFSGHDWSYFDVKPAVEEFFKDKPNKLSVVYNDMWYVIK